MRYARLTPFDVVRFAGLLIACAGGALLGYFDDRKHAKAKK